MLTPKQSQEWINLAAWAARRRSQGKPESPLPFGVSTAVVDEITNYPDEWERDIKANVYASEMDKIDEARTAPQEALIPKDGGAMKPGVVFGIAVKAGKFRANRITYNIRGVSKVLPLSGWVSLPEAQAAKEKAQAAYAEACAALRTAVAR